MSVLGCLVGFVFILIGLIICILITFVLGFIIDGFCWLMQKAEGKFIIQIFLILVALSAIASILMFLIVNNSLLVIPRFMESVMAFLKSI